MVIKLVNHIERCYSNEDGKIIKDIITSHLRRNEQIIVSFEGIKGATSSFVNTAFIELLNEFDFEMIKRSLKFINTTKQINTMIKDRFSFEVKKRQNLINA